jgi:hypothetical protein
MPLLDPMDGRCAPDTDPRLSEADRIRLLGEQWDEGYRHMAGCGCPVPGPCLEDVCPHAPR